MSLIATRGRELAPRAWTFLPRFGVPVAVAIGVALVMNFWIQPAAGDFVSKLLVDIGINIILAVSLTIVNGFTGQFSMGTAGFMALGGYAAGAFSYYASFRIWGNADFHGGWLSATQGLDATGSITGGDALFVGACLIGGCMAALAGYLVGLPSLRLRGDYLAIVTLGFGEIVRVVLQSTSGRIKDAEEIANTPAPKLLTHLGGALGLQNVPQYTSLFWVYFFMCITLFVTYRLKQSSDGRAFLSIREDEIASEAMGINTTKHKVRAFVISSFFAGLAGSLYAHQIGSINAGELGFQKSFDVIIMVVLGGMGSISGAVVAAALLTMLPELLRSPPSLWANPPRDSTSLWGDLSGHWPWGLIGAGVVAASILIWGKNKLRPLIVLSVLCFVWEGLRALAHQFDVNLADYRMVIYALALIVMMILRPQGIFGIREVWDFGPLRRFLRDPGPRSAPGEPAP